MAQYKTGTASVSNGLNEVNGASTLWLANAIVGNSFKFQGENAIYHIISVDSNTQLHISPNYAGTSKTAAVYIIARDFTSSGLYEISNNDVDWAYFSTLNARKIDTSLAINADGYIPKGDWNAYSNIPTIVAASSANNGWQYIVSVSGTTTVDGISSWKAGDKLISNGSYWFKISVPYDSGYPTPLTMYQTFGFAMFSDPIDQSAIDAAISSGVPAGAIRILTLSSTASPSGAIQGVSVSASANSINAASVPFGAVTGISVSTSAGNVGGVGAISGNGLGIASGTVVSTSTADVAGVGVAPSIGSASVAGVSVLTSVNNVSGSAVIPEGAAVIVGVSVSASVNGIGPGPWSAYTLANGGALSSDYPYNGWPTLKVPGYGTDDTTWKPMASRNFNAPSSGSFVLSTRFFMNAYPDVETEVMLCTLKSGSAENAGGSFYTYVSYVHTAAAHRIFYYSGSWVSGSICNTGPYSSNLVDIGHWYRMEITITIGGTMDLKLYNDVGTQIGQAGGATPLTSITAGLSLYHTILRRGGAATDAIYIADPSIA